MSGGWGTPPLTDYMAEPAPCKRCVLADATIPHRADCPNREES